MDEQIVGSGADGAMKADMPSEYAPTQTGTLHPYSYTHLIRSMFPSFTGWLFIL